MRKCGLQLDNDRYTDFKSIYGTEITEQYHPTLIAAMLNSERASSTIFVNTKQSIFKCIVDDWDYSCGFSLVPESHELYNVLFVYEKISCESPIELSYYSSRKNNPLVCYWCGCDQELLEFPTYMTSKYKFVFPLCSICQSKEKDFFARIEIKTNTKGQKRKRNTNS
ncbi:hypothetical protein RhiirC2_788663 [Rhizophagus irregularis]|uniref:Uncharacterized protein n=1 Tax=Rhizophagus irregularis TaxID=588596 RepID=A0A2N1MPT4_9GLOM|nr:hypothetical protein RhiirC2_788663 [Rhizophagus irregularis]